MLKNIENIIFDLGEVIIDLDFKLTENAFSKLLNIPNNHLYSYETQSTLFNKLETGEISPNNFRNEIRLLAKNKAISDNDINEAWNAMLLHIEPKKIELANQLRVKYATFVLSNTNEIHINYVNQYLLPKLQLNDLNQVFDYVYYSHKISARKPNEEAFKYILNRHKINPQKTLFIDDKLENIKAAQKLNFKTWHLTNRNDLYKLLT